ncbi:LCP family protein [Lacticaseibacillus zhaodongensis]|uniref:LCP family protein n=1 Tax=Lacticaseibacillus zhaodongensis TaxID=2668065 RepID=UPI0012D368E9|nr:LCP family protein [Lacticaseibacillus zhaodongensis]
MQNHESHQNHQHHNHHRKHRVRNAILWIVGIVLAAAVIFGGVMFFRVNRATSNVYSFAHVKTERSDSRTSKGKPVAYLLLGTDTGALGRTYKGRTDTIIVTVINPKTKTTTMVSIPRDTKISLDGATIKINAAYEYGNAKGSIKAVEKLLDINIDGYMLINMGGLEKLVNAVGGVDVTSPLTFTYSGKSFTKGQRYHLNGSDALKFSRMRYDDPDGDYGRQRRQQLVIGSVITKLKDNPATVTSGSFLNAVSDNVRTDVSLSSIKNLASKYRSAGGNVKHDQMKGNGKMINGQSYEVQPQSEITRVHKVIEDALGNK